VNVPSFDQDRLKVTSISCGSNLSGAIIESLDGSTTSKCYVWGSGLPGLQTRFPSCIGDLQIKRISCGQDHVGVITTDGQAFTWGSGDHGMLGHGTKQVQNVPKLVNALKDLVCLDISCGGFHTSFIACGSEKIKTSFLPDADPVTTPVFSGNLYCCGLPKAGQLGIGVSTKPHIATPVKVALPVSGNYCFQVSCGFHHTAVVAFDDHGGPTDHDLLSSSVLCCGWGEHGRLGNGDEEQRFEFTKVEFPPPTSASSKQSGGSPAFLPISVSCGEQHTIARGTDGMCYSWGNNGNGQLGIGNPSTSPQALCPTRIPIPEGMHLSSVTAGGRHSVAITYCGKLLSWGWGEEGQLGHGTEKNAYLPRPVRVPRLEGEMGVPTYVAAGMSHTLCIIKNEAFVYTPPKPVTIEKLMVADAKETLPKVPTQQEMKFYTPANVESEEEEEAPPEPVITHKKQGMVADDEEIITNEEEPVVRSVRELLRRKEEHM
jgi:alpha-tubulin suppressor-like RCC1 family protein